jgi:hydrogenase expression/formation protein HypC
VTKEVRRDHVLSVSGDDPLMRLGRVSFGGVVKEISLAYVPEANIGDYVIVHAGFAISTLDAGEAQRVFDYLQEMDALGELEDDTTGIHNN